MLHILKYRFLQVIREYSVLFWSLAFPIILGTFYYLSFGNIGLAGTGETSWDSIPVAVITKEDTSDTTHAFSQFLTELDGDMLKIEDISSEKEAIDALKSETIQGIYYVKDTPSLTVAKNGINESILTSLLDSYRRNANLLQKIAETHPERIADALNTVYDYQSFTKDTSLGGKTLDSTVQYFLALIAYACLSGAFLGVRFAMDSQANLSALGARRSITPTHKLTLILIDMLVIVAVHFLDVLILNLYIVKVLGFSLGDQVGTLILINLMGSLIGVCMGIVLGCVSRLSLGVRMGLCVALTLFPGFLAGLMFGDMKNIIETNCPILNRINPAAVLSDAYYCMGVYNDSARLTRCLIILAAMSLLCLIVAFLGVRRERYDSI
ncbi:ABC transporter permease [Faecalicatena contorta]|uniref:ABC transporter permease n=1 Tax=Faecalicatena contorta TaxID=39482 RepID=UPI001F46186C|nr:ABC transporter permease [Faecalicatena contorta]MCF2683465.1 ABC transporter permease [Faecalicatena contorta]